jgi:hypothetical protein
MVRDLLADYDEELSEIESEVDRLTRQVSGYERVGQSTPKYMATGECQSVCNTRRNIIVI